MRSITRRLLLGAIALPAMAQSTMAREESGKGIASPRRFIDASPHRYIDGGRGGGRLGSTRQLPRDAERTLEGSRRRDAASVERGKIRQRDGVDPCSRTGKRSTSC
jgi:hypothetical protein